MARDRSIRLVPRKRGPDTGAQSESQKRVCINRARREAGDNLIRDALQRFITAPVVQS